MTSQQNEDDDAASKDIVNELSLSNNKTPKAIITKTPISLSNSTSSSNSNSQKKKRLYIKKNENINSHNNNMHRLNSSSSSVRNNSSSSKMIDFNKDDGYVDDGDVDDEEEEGGVETMNDSNVDNEPIDPRIQIELERLNKASTDINKLENELEEAKNLFISTKNRQAQRIEYLQKKLGACISKSKPYFDALQAKEKLQKETHKAVQEFQKAVSHYTTAKETLAVAEQNICSTGISDVWQEYLSETITKINNYKRIADQAEDFHRNKALEYQMYEKRLHFLEKDLKRNIEKSQSYYEEKSRWNLQMEAQRNRIYDLERTLLSEKRVYSEAMNNLRIISDEIHQSRRTRKMRLKQRDDQTIVYKSTTQQILSEQISKQSPIKVSRSLDNLVKTVDSTDDATSECTSIDAISQNSKKSANEKRNLYAINSQKLMSEYFSFNHLGSNDNGAPQTDHSSRSSSPQYQSSSINDINSIENPDFHLESDNIRTSKSLYLLNRVESISDSNEDVDKSNGVSNQTYDSGKYSLTSFDAALNNDKLKKSLTANIIANNPKLNEAVKIDSRLPATPPRASNRNNSTKQEIPLLANLLMYNSVLTKATNSFNRMSSNDTTDSTTKSLRSSSFNEADKKVLR